MEDGGLRILKRDTSGQESISFVRGCEMKYFGQRHNIEVLLPETKYSDDFTMQDVKDLISGFHARHKAIYGWANPDYPVIFTTLKLQVIGSRAPFKPVEQPFDSNDALPALKRKRNAYLKESGGLIETPCYNGRLMRHGYQVSGPAIIEEVDTTIVVPPGAEVTVDKYGNYMVKR